MEVRAAGGGDRGDLGVRPAVDVVPALAEDGAVPGDHRADERVGAHPAQPAATELDRAVQEIVVVGVRGHRHGGYDAEPVLPGQGQRAYAA